MMSDINRSETCYQKNPSVVCTEFDDGAILLDLHTKYYYNLNETGLSVWKLLNEVSNISGIAEKIVNDYEVEKDRALESVRRIMSELCGEGLVITQ